MTKQITRLASIAVFAMGALVAQSAQANFVVVFEEVGSNVEAIGDGSIDLTDLGPASDTPTKPRLGVVPNTGAVFLGAKQRNQTFYQQSDITGPSNFGSLAGTQASGGSGDGVSKLVNGIAVPLGYSSGAALFDSLWFLNASYASLGMTPGVYTWNWGSGADADSFTIDIVAPILNAGGIPVANNSILSAELPLATVDVFPLTVPEPSTWAMMLIGFVGLGYAATRRKGVLRAISG